MSGSQFSLPGEWEHQSGILITWPHAHSDWADNIAEIEALYVNLSTAICRFEKLLIVAYDDSLQEHITSILISNKISLQNITFHIAKTNDTWTRDYGPICLTQHLNNKTKTKVVNFEFNGWGEKYSADLDNQLTNTLISKQTIQYDELQNINFILEGGSIESDGNGTVLTTSRCLLSANRNSPLSHQDITALLQNTLGVNQVLWLSEGYLAGDDTDNHIDVLARFIDAKTIVYIKCENKEDEHYVSSVAMETQLKSFNNLDGKNYKLIPLPFPEAKYNENNRRLPASYANFLIINGAVLVPTYDDPNDKTALNILQKCFRDREIINIPFNAAINQNGSLHCLTMQLPLGTLKAG